MKEKEREREREREVIYQSREGPRVKEANTKLHKQRLHTDLEHNQTSLELSFNCQLHYAFINVVSLG